MDITRRICVVEDGRLNLLPHWSRIIVLLVDWHIVLLVDRIQLVYYSHGLNSLVIYQYNDNDVCICLRLYFCAPNLMQFFTIICIPKFVFESGQIVDTPCWFACDHVFRVGWCHSVLLCHVLAQCYAIRL